MAINLRPIPESGAKVGTLRFTPAPKGPAMAQRVHVLLEDDLDGSEAVETISFALDGKSYEIDLNKRNAAKLRKALDPFVAAGRKAGRPTGGRRQAAAAAPQGNSAQEIRAWARSNGYDVPDRGRIPSHVRQAFESAH
ncbi:Lsr2 family protein [Nocardioides sp. AN3]